MVYPSSGRKEQKTMNKSRIDIFCAVTGSFSYAFDGFYYGGFFYDASRSALRA
jgi:hypothetical protein